MARTLSFHFIFSKFMENTSNKPTFSQCNIFHKCKYFFFNLCSDLFSIIAKKIQENWYNVVCAVARLVLLFCCGFTMGHCNAFQYIFINQKESEFYGAYFETMLFLVTMRTAILYDLKKELLSISKFEKSKLIIPYCLCV